MDELVKVHTKYQTSYADKTLDTGEFLLTEFGSPLCNIIHWYHEYGWKCMLDKFGGKQVHK